jgi:hypothetical protein
LGAAHLAENPPKRPHFAGRAGAQRRRGLGAAAFGTPSRAEARRGFVYPLSNPLDEWAGRGRRCLRGLGGDGHAHLPVARVEPTGETARGSIE